MWRLQYKEMEKQVEDLKHRVENLKKEKDKLDDQWADQFGTAARLALALSGLRP